MKRLFLILAILFVSLEIHAQYPFSSLVDSLETDILKAAYSVHESTQEERDTLELLADVALGDTWLEKHFCFSLKQSNGRRMKFFMQQANSYLLYNDSLIYKLPQFATTYVLEQIKEVGFVDANEDGYLDIVLILQMYRGYGPIEHRYTPHYEHDIYFGGKTEFTQVEFLMNKMGLDTMKPINTKQVTEAYRKYQRSN